MAVKIAVNTWLFALRFTDERVALLDSVRDLGFEAVEISLMEPGDIHGRKMRGELTRRGLTCSSVAVICGEGRDLRGTAEEQRAALEFLKGCIDTTADLECGLLNGPLYSRVGRTDAKPTDPRQEQLRTVAAHLRALEEYAQKRGVLLAIEPILRFETDLINTCAEALELIALTGSPRLGVHLDTFHMNVEEANPVLAVVRAGGRLLNLHAADNHRSAPGTGAFDWQGLRDALHHIGYDRYVTIEAFHPDAPDISFPAAVRRKQVPTNADVGRRGLAFLRALFAE